MPPGEAHWVSWLAEPPQLAVKEAPYPAHGHVLSCDEQACARAGVALCFATTVVIGRLPSLVGILCPESNAAAFWRVLYTAGAMSLLGGVYPAVRAARLSPLEALRRE